MQDPRLAEEKKEELERKLDQLVIETFYSESDTAFLALIPPLIRPGKGVFFTKEGYIRTDNTEYNPTKGITHKRVERDSISALSENQKEVFFKTLSFLDEVGGVSKELGLQDRGSERLESNQGRVEDLRNVARAVK
jgi:hypothetical protein